MAQVLSMISREEATVTLSPAAFSSIVISTVNSHANEWMGLLVGTAQTEFGQFTGEHVVPILSARMRHGSVDPSGSKYKRIVPLIPVLYPGLEIIGDVHSHPGWGHSHCSTEPSDFDLKKSKAGQVYVVVAVHRSKRSWEWRTVQDGSITGSLGGFAIRVSAYRLDRGQRCGWRSVQVGVPGTAGVIGIKKAKRTWGKGRMPN